MGESLVEKLDVLMAVSMDAQTVGSMDIMKVVWMV